MRSRIYLLLSLTIAMFFHTFQLYGESTTINPFSEDKSYYEIESDVDLKGKTIKLPKNAVLIFKGGLISNGILVCDNVILEGHRGISRSVVLYGTIKGPLDLSVFELSENDRCFDMGLFVNAASNVCKNIIIPEGTYFFSTPITLKNVRFYKQYGDLYYNGKATDVVAVQFNGGNSSDINILGKIYYDTQNKAINYTKAHKTSIIGVEFVNFNNSNISIGDVAYFNNNIRVSGYGAGTSYNKFSIGLSAFSNEHLRIFQKNMPFNQIGWCNENIFYGGRFSNWSHFDWKECESVAIRIEGAGVGDTYNSANSLLFIKPCMEGFKESAVYAKNVKGCHWLDARTEGSQLFIRFVGDCLNNDANSLYGTDFIDFSECTTYPLKMKELHTIYTTFDSRKHVLEVETKDAKIFKVLFDNSDAKGRVGVQYLIDDKGRSISKIMQRQLMRPRSTTFPHSYYYNCDAEQWLLAADSSESEFVIPKGVTKVRLFLTGRFGGVTIYSDKTTKVIEQ